MRIAILDDNQLDIDYFKARAESFLKKKGDRTYQISEYTSGVPLVDDVKDGEWFDLIVLDIILKDGENGIDVAYKLRGSGYSGSLMFWTAHAGYMRDIFEYLQSLFAVSIDFFVIFILQDSCLDAMKNDVFSYSKVAQLLSCSVISSRYTANFIC